MLKSTWNRRTLLKRSGQITALGVLAQIPYTNRARAHTRVNPFSHIWSNWSGNVEIRPKAIYEPQNLEHVRAILAAAPKVKIVGSGHSYNDIAAGEVIISTRHFKKIDVDAYRKEVWAEAGVTLEALNRELDRHGLALPTTGEIDDQTIPGMIATGTRGAGVQFGSFSDADLLTGIELMTADGNLHKYDLETMPDQNLAAALRLNLGALGFIYRVRLKVRNAFNLKDETRIGNLEDALNPRHYLDNYRYFFAYYPYADTAVMRFQNETHERAESADAYADRVRAKHNKENILGHYLIKFLSITRAWIPFVQKQFTKTFKPESFVNRSNLVMVMGKRTMKYYEMCFSIPVERADELFTRFKSLTERLAANNEYYSAMPLFVRFSRGDKGTLLSTAPDSYRLYMHVDFPVHTSFRDYKNFYKQLEAEMIQITGAKPHWAKLFLRNPAKSYPEMKTFVEIAHQMDPTGKFRNKYLDRLFYNS